MVQSLLQRVGQDIASFDAVGYELSFMKQFGPKNSMDTALHASHGRVL
jgi:hypothetical protein